MKEAYFRRERHGAVVLARIQNPPKQYFTIGMLPELNALMDEVQSDPEILVVAFAGAPADAFLSHLAPEDLETLLQNPDEVSAGLDDLSLAYRVFLRMSRLPLITIAAINGRAWGAGCEFALACDLRLASDSSATNLAMLEATLGLTPGAGAVQRLRQIVGPSRAFHLLLSAKAVEPTEALRLGLVHEVLRADRFLELVLDRAQQFTFHTRESIGNLKRCALEGGDDPEAAFRLEQRIYVDGLKSELVRRRARQFVENRVNGSGGLSAGMPRFLLEPVFRGKPSLIIHALAEYFDPKKARNASGVYCLQITGPRGGSWTVHIRDGTLRVEPGIAESADVTMTAAAKDWVEFITGRVDDIELFVTNRMRVYGDLMKALEFESFFAEG